jgi:hypothetical protein
MSDVLKKIPGNGKNILEKIKKDVQTNKKIYLKVGVLGGIKYPSKRKDGGGETEYVAKLARQHEFGSTANNEPPRPTFRVAIKNNIEKYKNIIKKGNKAISNGESETQRAILARIGEVAVSDIKLAIKAISDPALKESTVKARARERSSYGGTVTDSLRKPLIDHAIELNSISYEIVEE